MFIIILLIHIPECREKSINTQYTIVLIVPPSQPGRVGARGGAVCVRGAESTTASIPQKCQIQEWN